ncbi:MAG: outer membrane beta-barrel protein [Gemmatimonadales bacterium]
MKAMVRRTILIAGLAGAAAPVQAQSIYLGLRGGAGIPTGSFNENLNPPCAPPGCTALNAAKTGFGYGLDAGVGLGMFGVYAGFDNINFDCQSGTCNSDGKYRLQGVTAGIRLMPPGMSVIRPWVKAGVTFNELEGGYGSGAQEVTTDRNPGYEIGAGVDIPVFGLFSLYPQARYVGQNFKYSVPGVTNTATQREAGVNYFTFDLGLSVHNPLSGMRR